MCNSRNVEDICSNSHLTIATTDTPGFIATTSVLPPSNMMPVRLQQHQVSSHHVPTCIKPPHSDRASQSQPRDHKTRRQSSRTVKSSRIDVAYQQDPEGLVSIPLCLLEKHIEYLAPVVATDEREGSAEQHGQKPLCLVNQPIHGSGDLFGGSYVSQLQTDGRQDSTKFAPQRAVTHPYSLSSISLALDSDKHKTLADLVYAQYVSITDDCLSQEMLWEVEALEDAKPKAPVTKENLRELDLQSIQNTISLRFDLCFDQGLFFQRVSGAKGSQKRAKAQIFYRYMSLELQSINHDLQGQCELCQDSKTPRYTMPSRLACYFWSLLDLLNILVPESERESIRDAIDPAWLTRMVRVGIFDAKTFSAWLHALLTRHCAPMRDAMAGEMHEKLCKGASDGDMDLLTEGMETLLCLLENMKIDIANHQIRTFKFLLIADTVSFLKDCFSKMHDKRQIQLKDSRRWYNKARKGSAGRSEFESFMQGFIRLLCITEDEFELSTTFQYGEDRIHGLHNEILDYAHLEICMTIHQERLGSVTATHLEELAVKHRILQLMTNPEGTSEGVRQHVQNIDLEIRRAVLDHAECSRPKSASNLVQSMILDDDGTDFADLKDVLNEKEEDELSSLSERLLEPTLLFAKKFLKMDTLQISNYQRACQDQRANNGSTEVLVPDITDLSSKIAHMGVIHWQIWAELAYLDES